MADDDRDRSLRGELERRFLELRGKLPTSSLGRLSRSAVAALRGGRLAWRARKVADGAAADLDLDQLVALVSSVGQLKGVAMKAGQLMSYLDLTLHRKPGRRPVRPPGRLHRSGLC